MTLLGTMMRILYGDPRAVTGVFVDTSAWYALLDRYRQRDIQP